MGFLDSIGQRPAGSASPTSRSTVGQSVTRNDAARALAPPPPKHSPQPDRIHPAVIWGAALIVVAAIAVAAWLGVRVNVVPPKPQAAADATADAAPPAERTTQNRGLVRPRTVARSASKAAKATGGRASGRFAEPATAEDVPVIAPASESGSDAAATSLEALSDSVLASSVAPLSEDDFVYSSEGAGVVGPRLTSLGFVHRLVSGLRVRTSTIELVVSKSGTVERAKIYSTPAHWEDALLLSRAKMFQFVPAYRNGFPVRYRFVMNVETSP